MPRLKELCASLLDPDLLAEILEALNPEAQTALEALVAKNGRIPWAEFTRRFGDIREIGPGKRDRETATSEPGLHRRNPVLPGVCWRALSSTPPTVPQEFAYIPDDLLRLIHYQQQRS